MKICILFSFIVISLSSFAQEDINKADKLSIWYRNSYQPASQKQTMVAEDKIPSRDINMVSLKGADNFLYYPSYRLGVNSLVPYYYTGSKGMYMNSYNYGMYYLPSLAPADIGGYFLASGINYVIDKTFERKKKKRD